MEPDTIGGYVERDGRNFLRLQKDPRQYEFASDVYTELRPETIDFNPAWDARSASRSFLYASSKPAIAASSSHWTRQIGKQRLHLSAESAKISDLERMTRSRAFVRVERIGPE
jgi:hypothetical protein